MEPYLFSAKNEMKIIIENFAKEIGYHKKIETDMNYVKETVQENKKIILVFQEEQKKKFQDYAQKFHNVNKQFEDVKLNFTDFTKRVKIFEKLYENLEQKSFQMEEIKNNIHNFETNYDSNFNSFEEKININYSGRFKNIEINVDILKNSQNKFNTTLLEISKTNSNLESLTKDFSQSNQNLKEELNDFKENNNLMNYTLTGLSNKFENISNGVSNNNEKISNFQKNYGTLNEKISIVQDGVKDLTERINIFDISETEIKENLSSLSNNYNTTRNDVSTLTSIQKTCTDKFIKIGDKINEQNQNILNSTNDKLREINETNQKINEYSKEKISKINDQIIIINSNINDLNLNYNSCKSNINNISNSLADKNNPVEQVKVNELFEKSLSEIVKQIIVMRSDIEKLKSENITFEENFESISDNFDKLSLSPRKEEKDQKVNQLEKNQNIVNEIIKTMTFNNEEYKKKIEEQFNEMDIWRESLLEELIKNQGAMKIDMENKINEISLAMLNNKETTAKGTSISINNKTDNLIDELNKKQNEFKSEVDNKLKEFSIKINNINKDNYDSFFISNEKLGLINTQVEKLKDGYLINENRIKNIDNQLTNLDEKIIKIDDKITNIDKITSKDNIYDKIKDIEKQFSHNLLVIENNFNRDNELHRMERAKINLKLNENEEKIGNIINYFDPKIDEIVECINLICTKYDFNIALNNNNPSVNPNVSNNNSNNLNILQNSNIENVSTNNFIPIWPSGYANNFTGISNSLFQLKKDSNDKIEFKNDNELNKSENEFQLKSEKNEINEKTSKLSSPKKFNMNKVYLSTNPINFNEIKSEMKGYLNKDLFFQKHYENVIEVDLEMQQSDYYETTEVNYNLKSNPNTNHKGLDRLSKLTEILCKEESLQPLYFNDDIFCNDDLDDFDRDSNEGSKILKLK